ncbi:MAG: copper homeostasis protein CutC [Marinilabiliales bacterium]|nr:MAG: copper homeostasis protein CutC [Marinilabiliales bacterium]
MKHKVEICTDTIQSVESAIKGGANRIEICSALELGGLTPSIGFVKHAVDKNQIKVNVLIRPRPGSFVYSDEEYKIICEDIKRFKELGINGIVCGILKADGSVDFERTKEIVALSNPLEFTFHRAFDNCLNPEKAIQDVLNTGANRILTSGFERNVTDGMDNILKLHNKYGNSIIIMPGGGINIDNAKTFLKNGINEIHLSAGKFKVDLSYSNSKLAGMGHYLKDNKIGYSFSDIEIINNIVNL